MQKLTATFQTGNRGINKRVAVTIATVLACGACLWLGSARIGDTSSAGTPSPKQVSIAEATANPRMQHTEQWGQSDQIIITHAEPAKAAREAAAFQAFRSEIAEATQDLDSSEASVNGVVDRLTSLKACLSLTYFMANDFFTGDSEVDTILIAEAEELDHLTSNAVNHAKLAIDRLHAALKMIEGTYSETYIAGPESIGGVTRLADSVTAGVSARDLGQLELTKAISSDSSLGSAAALLSATALAKTANRGVWSVFSVVEKKTAQRMAVAAFPAIADGPFPVGDLVALALESGCLAWGFHEVYVAQGAIKNDLHRELTGVMTQNSKQIQEWAMNVGNELMETAALSVPAPKAKRAARTHARK